ncbi:hypothetical protein [Streptomyces sp. NPDC001165]|uniref:hypothetical protein n=1 Tax=Streptomyces sp. NPDC001165 TaxID=3364546 RepID=UPI003680D5C6
MRCRAGCARRRWPGGGARTLETGHVIAATGFRAGRDRLRPLSPELRALPATAADSAPEVGRMDFELSYPAGLFLAGLVTAPGFGPAMRLVHGATFTAGTLVRGAGADCARGRRIPAARRGEVPETVRH